MGFSVQLAGTNLGVVSDPFKEPVLDFRRDVQHVASDVSLAEGSAIVAPFPVRVRQLLVSFWMEGEIRDGRVGAGGHEPEETLP